ncbi:preprotein translocase subunit SecY [Alistipes putredinis]|uniref:preprotein translocase subunit SecY n=1 Tax=Alistipes putredinis TaxID=28117 RepID=UPI003AB57FF3
MNGYGYLIVGIVVVAIIALLATNKKFVETLKNIYKIEELRKRILYTLGLLLVYRLGCFVVIPGINPNALGEGSALASQLEGNGLLGLLNVFSGGAFGNAAIFALGVMPYITASIIIQLMGIMIPYFQKMQKEGESGRRKMNQWTRMLTIIVLLIQGPAYIMNLYHQVPEAFVYGNTFLFLAYATVILIAGTMFIMWLGEKITDKGIGNGISLIIMIGIVARLPHALLAEINARFQTSDGSAIMLILELVLLFLVFMATVALVQAVRKIPVQYAKRIVGNKQYGGVRQYIPLKMNAANVMPIIFAQALMFIPMLFANVAPGFAAAFSDMRGFWYNLTLGILVVAFTYFYTAIIINPQMMADDMKRNGGFIPGVKPGKATVNYIDTIMTRITLPGSIFLALVAILPALAMKFLNIQQAFAYFYGGTSLLIMVGVILDTLKQIESYLLMRHYDGLMKTGRIQGRY